MVFAATWMLSALAQAGPIQVTLLGTGRPTPLPDRLGASTLVEAGDEALLFDCGRGAFHQLARAGAPIAAVDALFVTHLHSDHVVGIPDVWLTGWIMGREVPLEVWGPAGTASMMEHLQAAYAFDVHLRRDVQEALPGDGAEVLAVDVPAPAAGEAAVVYERGGVTVRAFSVAHQPVEPAFGYRVDYAGRSVVISGDTAYSETLERVAAGADVVVHEVIVARPEELETSERKRKIYGYHTPAAVAGGIFTAAGTRLGVFTHVVVMGGATLEQLEAEARQTWAGPLVVGEDLTVIDVGEVITVTRPGAQPVVAAP